MAVTTLDAPASTNTGLAGRRTGSATVAAPGRTRRPGSRTSPAARPSRPAPPAVVAAPRLAARSCSVTSPAVEAQAQSAPLRLTDRGIALVLVTGVLILTAALAVVGLTALRVTGERYQDARASVLVQP